jgi:hypothetical protein
MAAAWIERQSELADLAKRTLFFIGGAPRTGTTWLQHLLDAHPDICCRGEGHFLVHMVEPLGALMNRRRSALEAKNQQLFKESGGYPLPKAEDFEVLAGTAILLALHQQTEGNAFACVGEKTPENVFYFPNLKRLFPAARFVGIVRDPRDSLASAWHMFHKPEPDEDETEAKFTLLRRAFPSLLRGTRLILDYQQSYPQDVKIVRYETMLSDAASVAAELYRFLEVSDAPELVARCVRKTSFAAMSGGRAAGMEDRGSFFRKGVAGGWRSTLTPDMNDLILEELGWMFPLFGWEP